MAYIAGHFSLKWSSSPGGSSGISMTNFGDTENGIEIVQTNYYQKVVADSFGDSMPDGVQRGADCILRFNWIEYDKLVAAGLPFVQVPLIGGGTNANCGKLLSALAGTLEMTPISGTGAYTQFVAQYGNGKSLFATLAIPETDISFMLNNRVRTGPLVIRCLPDPNQSEAPLITATTI
jgi:hypothetical protein